MLSRADTGPAGAMIAGKVDRHEGHGAFVARKRHGMLKRAVSAREERTAPWLAARFRKLATEV